MARRGQKSFEGHLDKKKRLMHLLSDGHLDKIKPEMQLPSEGHREKKRCRMLLSSESGNGHLNKSIHTMQLSSGVQLENNKNLVQLSSGGGMNIKTRAMLEKEKDTMQLPSGIHSENKKQLVQLSSGGRLNVKTRSMLEKEKDTMQLSSGVHSENMKQLVQLSSGGHLKVKTRSMLEKDKHTMQLSSEGNLVKKKHIMQLFSEGNLGKNKSTIQLSYGGHLEKEKHAIHPSPTEIAKHPLQLSSERDLTKRKHFMQLSSEGYLEKNKLMHSTDLIEEINTSMDPVDDQMNVYFRLMHLIPFEVKKQDTIEKVVTEVSESEGLSIKTMCFQGNWLEGEHKLVDYGVMNGSIINIFVDSEFRIKIHVTLASSKKTLTLDVDKRNTIHSIKGKIQNKEGFTASHFDLIYLGEGLDDRKTLGDYNIEEGSTIDALFHLADALQIYISFRKNRRISLQVKSWYSGKDVKHVIESMVGIPRCEQKLYLGQVKLRNHMMVADLGIRQGQTLNLFSGTCLCVQTLRGRELLFEVDEPPTIDNVQSMIQERENIPITESPRLVFYGKQLHKHTHAFADSDAGEKARLCLVLPCL